MSHPLIEIVPGKRGGLLAYLVHMTLRIVEIHRVLKPTGSFYLHCNPTASHYLKLVLDAVYCGQGGDFRNGSSGVTKAVALQRRTLPRSTTSFSGTQKVAVSLSITQKKNHTGRLVADKVVRFSILMMKLELTQL